jgi:hypothetical protein
MPAVIHKTFRVVITALEQGKRYSAHASCDSGGQATEDFAMAEITLAAPAADPGPGETTRQVVINAGGQPKPFRLLFDHPPDEAPAE